MCVECSFGNAFFEKRRVGGDGTLVLVFVAVRRRQIAAVYRAINRDFTFRTAADGAYFFRLCGAKAAFFSFFANRARQTRSPGWCAWKNTVRVRKRKIAAANQATMTLL